MLRGPSIPVGNCGAVGTPNPNGENFSDDERPFTLEERPPGIVFYRAKDSFWHPYALLQSVRWQEDELTLRFSTLDVEINGRGLQIIYAHLAAHRLARLNEQGERYAAVATTAVYVSRITEVPRAKE